MISKPSVYPGKELAEQSGFFFFLLPKAVKRIYISDRPTLKMGLLHIIDFCV